MNIGIVTTWFPAGGGYVSKAYREILSKEHNVLIYARGGKKMTGDPFWDDEKVTWAPVHYNGIKTAHLIRWAKRNKIDVLFFNEQRYWKPVIAAKRAGICIGAYIDYYTQTTIPAFEIYDFLICNTKRHYSVFNWHRNTFYIPWGTDVQKFKPIAGTNDRKLTFLISAGWQGQYGGDRRGTLLALEAFNKVRGDIVLRVYSQVSFSNCRPEWQRLINSDARIQFIHGTFDPFPFHEGDVYLYPSRLEGIGLTLPESISSGLVAITTDNAPMNEFVTDGFNGKLVTVEKYLGRPDGYYWAESICSLDSLQQIIQYYIDNRNLVLMHKNQAREYALTHLNWVTNSKKLSSIFTNISNSNRNHSKKIYELPLYLDKQMAPSKIYRLLTLFKY